MSSFWTRHLPEPVLSGQRSGAGLFGGRGALRDPGGGLQAVLAARLETALLLWRVS